MLINSQQIRLHRLTKEKVQKESCKKRIALHYTVCYPQRFTGKGNQPLADRVTAPTTSQYLIIRHAKFCVGKWA